MGSHELSWYGVSQNGATCLEKSMGFYGDLEVFTFLSVQNGYRNESRFKTVVFRNVFVSSSWRPLFWWTCFHFITIFIDLQPFYANGRTQDPNHLLIGLMTSCSLIPQSARHAWKVHEFQEVEEYLLELVVYKMLTSSKPTWVAFVSRSLL